MVETLPSAVDAGNYLFAGVFVELVFDTAESADPVRATALRRRVRVVKAFAALLDYEELLGSVVSTTKVEYEVVCLYDAPELGGYAESDRLGAGAGCYVFREFVAKHKVTVKAKIRAVGAVCEKPNKFVELQINRDVVKGNVRKDWGWILNNVCRLDCPVRFNGLFVVESLCV